MGSEWKTYKVKEFAEVVGGGTPRTKIDKYWNGDIPWITPKDLSDHKSRYISYGERFISSEGLENSSAKMVSPGTVLLSSRAPVGYLAIAKNPLSTNQGFRNLVVKEGFSPEFVYYLLKNNIEYLQRNASGTTFQELSGGTIKTLEFKIPDYKTQCEIAETLGVFDDKIELNQRMNQTLEAIARAVFKSWFVDFDPVRAKMAGEPYPLPDAVMALFPDELVDSELGMIPKGWEVGKLGDFIKILDSKRIPLSRREREKRKGDYPYYGATKIIDYVDDFIFDGKYVLMGEDGSVVTESGHPVLQYVWGKFWANNHAHVLQGKNGFSTEYLYILLSQKNISPFVTGAVQPKINQKNMKKISVIRPNHQALNKFDTLIQKVFSFIRYNQNTIESILDIRNAYIEKFFSNYFKF